MLAKHLLDQHGEKYLKKFANGLMRGGAGINVVHAPYSPATFEPNDSHTGGQTVPPGGVAPKAYGNPPQAPASFQRNTVGMGMSGGRARKAAPVENNVDKFIAAGIEGGGQLTIHHGEGKPKRTNARGQMISKLMKERGMTLPEASRYIKEHGSA
jgi:hypothetical protein